MMRLRLLPVYGILAAVIVLPAAGCANLLSANFIDTFHTTVPYAPATIAVRDSVGGVELDAWNKPQVEIEARKRGSTIDEARAITISADQHGSTLVVEAHFPQNVSNCQVELTIHAPASANLDVNVGVGGILTKGFTGNLDAHTDTGGVATTMAALGGSQHVVIHIGVGGLALTIPNNSSASVSASTSVGAIKSDFPLTLGRNFVGQSGKGTIGSGSAAIDLSVGTGGIAIRRE